MIGHLVDMPGDVSSSVFPGGNLAGLNHSYRQSNLDLFCLDSTGFQKEKSWHHGGGWDPQGATAMIDC